MAIHNEIGVRGEKAAVAFLVRNGYRIIACNWRYKRAEVDIIAEQGNKLIFVEVKTRSSTDFGLPEEFVSEPKQNLLMEAAEAFILANNYEGEIRFDIISVLVKTANTCTIRHIKDAFWG